MSTRTSVLRTAHIPTPSELHVLWPGPLAGADPRFLKRGGGAILGLQAKEKGGGGPGPT